MLCMRIAMSKKSFLTNCFTRLTHRAKFSPVSITCGKTIACSFSQNYPQQSPGENEGMMGKQAMVGLAAGMFTLRRIDDAFAGKIDDTVGGHRFSSSVPKRRVVIKKPKKTFAVHRQVGGYGYQVAATIFGSWGWASFSLFGPGPNVAASVGPGHNIKAILFFMLLGAAVALLRSRAEQKKKMKMEIKITTSRTKRF